MDIFSYLKMSDSYKKYTKVVLKFLRTRTNNVWTGWYNRQISVIRHITCNWLDKVVTVDHGRQLVRLCHALCRHLVRFRSVNAFLPCRRLVPRCFRCTMSVFHWTTLLVRRHRGRGVCVRTGLYFCVTVGGGTFSVTGLCRRAGGPPMCFRCEVWGLQKKSVLW